MGKTAVPQANPGRDETVGSGTEKTNGGGARSIGSSSLTGGHLSYIRTKTCPKKRPVGGHSYSFTPVGVRDFLGA